MHVPENRLQRVVRILQCQKGSFPQVYLGLPLSNVKLNLAAFTPLISKVDRRLAGWQSALLNHQGRLVLINSALDGLTTYMMQAVALPPGVIAAIDKKRRAFLWAGTDKTSGSKCLVRWEVAQKPKVEGGLGVRDLATQNACLLLKLLHRLHHPEESAWAAWARQHTDLSTLEGANDGNHWDGLKSLLPAYRCITKVVIGDGASTTFWWDSWTEGTTLALKFPCLLSHCTQPNVSVREVCIRGLATILVPRLSPQACSEKAEVEAIIASINLQQQPDERSSKFTCTANRLDTGSIYRVSTHSGQVSMIDNFVWKSRAPPRVRFFGWLLLHERIQCRANLHNKHVLDDDICELCGQSAETCDHLIFQCTVARSFWNHLGWRDLSIPPVNRLWELPRPAEVPSKLFSTMILLCCWQIWNHRHDVVFRQQQPCLRQLLATAKEACRLWSCHLKVEDRWIVDKWCAMFVMN